MALGIVEVEAAAAEIAVDLLRLLLAGIGPVVQAARSDAGKDRIELLVADQKGVVLQRDLPIALVEVERGAIVELAHQERSEEHTSELQSLMRISYAVFCLKQKKNVSYTIK